MKLKTLLNFKMFKSMHIFIGEKLVGYSLLWLYGNSHCRVDTRSIHITDPP